MYISVCVLHCTRSFGTTYMFLIAAICLLQNDGTSLDWSRSHKMLRKLEECLPFEEPLESAPRDVVYIKQAEAVVVTFSDAFGNCPV